VKAAVGAEGAIAALLEAFGLSDAPETEGTPARVARFWRESLVVGHRTDPIAALGRRIPVTTSTVVTLTDIPFHGMCPHHLVPYFGEVHLAYDPGDHIVGLGGLEALVAALSRRLVLQEQLCVDLLDALEAHLGARGAACAIEATHLCLILRGREPRRARVHTRLARGTLAHRPDVLPPVGASRATAEDR